MVHIRMPGITVWLKTEDNPQLSLWQSQLEVATNRINRDTSSILFLEKYLMGHVLGKYLYLFCSWKIFVELENDHISR